MNDTERVIELLCSCLAANTVLDANSYVVNPALGHFRASQIPYCDRKIVFSSLVKVFKHIGIDARAIDIANSQIDQLKKGDALGFAASSGTILHNSFQSLLGDTEIVRVVIEEPVFIPFGTVYFHGHIDIQLVTDDAIWLIDLKTKQDFDWLDRTGQADSHNIEQVTIYNRYLQLKFPEHKIKPFILYMLRTEKNQLGIIELFYPENWRVFPAAYSSSTLERLIDKAVHVKQLCQNAKLPAISSESWQCENSYSTCVYYDICHQFKPADLYELGLLFTENDFTEGAGNDE